MPSLHEGMPVALAEALVVGLPSVVSDAPGFRWASVLDGVTALPHDVDQWTRAIPLAVSAGRDLSQVERVAHLLGASLNTSRSIEDWSRRATQEVTVGDANLGDRHDQWRGCGSCDVPSCGGCGARRMGDLAVADGRRRARRARRRDCGSGRRRRCLPPRGVTRCMPTTLWQWGCLLQLRCLSCDRSPRSVQSMHCG